MPFLVNTLQDIVQPFHSVVTEFWALKGKDHSLALNHRSSTSSLKKPGSTTHRGTMKRIPTGLVLIDFAYSIR